MGAKLDLTGRRFGRWTVLEEAGRRNGGVMWKCRCDCGTVREVRSNHLVMNRSVSCGCYNKEIITTHGNTKTDLHHVWANMKDRCLNAKSSESKNYLKRGITICKEWIESYEAFERWAKENGYKKGLTLDRIDNDGNYEPSNCRWADMKTQCRNRRSNVFLEYLGERHCISEWAEITNQPYARLSSRHRRGWSDKEIIFGRA